MLNISDSLNICFYFSFSHCFYAILYSSVHLSGLNTEIQTLYTTSTTCFYQLHFTCVLTVMYFFVHLDVYDSVRFVHI